MAAFGETFAPFMVQVHFQDGVWTQPVLRPLEPIALHPGAHVLHYASTCFEGLKAYRGPDGLHVFRLDRHIQRLRDSASHLCLPQPPADRLEAAIRQLVEACQDQVPKPPGSLYLRPLLIGTDANIGAATKPPEQVLLTVLAAPVGDYFTGGLKPLRVLMDETHARARAGFGQVKTGGNYASALAPLLAARREQQADQVLFCPGGDVQETGAANFLWMDNGGILTKPLDGSVLAGVTRDSVLTLARDRGLAVREEDFTVDQLLDQLEKGEAALSGTAAVLAPVGTLIVRGEERRVGDGGAGTLTMSLREQLTGIQFGTADDPHGWRFPIT